MVIFTHKPLKYAVIMCVVVAVCLIIMTATGGSFESKSPLFAVVTLLAPLVVWYVGIKAKKRELKGKMSFKEGVAEGFRISVYYAIVSPFVFLTYYMANPYVVPEVGRMYGLTNASHNYIIAFDLGVEVVASLIGGTLYGAIVSLFLRNKK